jgi:hypothetical protein
MAYEPKNELVRNRALKVQTLVIPFVVVGNATPASVALSCDEGGFMFMQSQGVNQITPALDAGETATYTTTLNDANGILNILIKLRDDVAIKICEARVINRISGAAYPAYLGSASGLTSSAEGLMVAATLPAFNTAVTVDACLRIDYVVQE